MIIFKSSTIEELLNEFNDSSYDISLHIVSEICQAIEENKEKALIGVAPNIPLQEKTELEFYVDKENFLETLRINLPNIEAMENYFMCSVILENIKILEKNNI
jgi:hypothetical protein